MFPYLRFSILVIMVLPIHIFGQNVKTLSLSEALELAITSRKELGLQKLKIEQSQTDINILSSRKSPTLKASGDVRYNPVLQTSIIPGAAFQTSSGPGEDREVQFGTRFNALLGLEGNYRLIDPTYKTDVDIANLTKQQAESNWEKEKIEIQFQVSKAFFEALLQKEVLKLSSEQLSKAENFNQVAEVQGQNGSILSNDLLKFKRDLAVAKSNKEIAESQYNQFCKELAFRVGLPNGTEIEPSGDWSNPFQNAIDQNLPEDDINKRPELVQTSINMNLASLNSQRQEQQYKPTLDFYTNINAQHLSNDFAVWNNWFPFVFGGLRVQMNLYDGGLKNKNIEKYSLEYKWQSAQLEKLKSDYSHDWSTAQNDFKIAQKNISIQEENILLAKEILNNDEIKFKEGALLSTQLRESQMALKEANQLKISFLAAAFQARLRMMRVSGKINP